MKKEIVFLHGWGVNSQVWQPISEKLSENFRLHLIDLPGHGNGFYDIGINWLDQLASEFPYPVHLCGWSLGGQIALEWARRHPTGKIALFGTTPRFVGKKDWPHGMPFPVFDEFCRSLETDMKAAHSRFLALVSQHDARQKHILTMLRRIAGKPSLEGLQKGLKILGENDLRNEIPHIPQPVLVLHGKNDSLVPHEAGRWLSENMPNAELFSFPDCGHAPFLSRPDACAKLLKDFFL